MYNIGINTGTEDLYGLYEILNNDTNLLFWQFIVLSTKIPDDEIIKKCKRLIKSKKMIMNLHLPYALNLSNKMDIEKLLKLMEMSSELGVKNCILHVGKMSQKEFNEKSFIRNMKEVKNRLSHSNPKLLIENPAGQGNELFTEFDSFIDMCKETGFNACIDTCHAFANGIDLKKVLTIKNKRYIKLIHLNDSKVPFNSKKDLHAPLFKGMIPKDLLEFCIDYIRKNKIDTILETDEMKVVNKIFNKKFYYKIKGIKNLNKKISDLIFKDAENEKGIYGKTALLNSAKIIETLDFKIDLSNYKELRNYKGIGEGTITRVEEILKTGGLKGKKKEINEVKEKERILKRSDLKFLASKYILAGSYRRGKELLGDVDIIVRDGDEYNRLKEDLKKKYSPVKNLVNGDKKESLKVNIKGKNVQVDILKVYKKEEFIPSLLYFTGSKNFNITMRKIAKDKGFLLNQYGLFKGDKRVDIKSEKDIFKMLDMKYLSPEKREF